MTDQNTLQSEINTLLTSVGGIPVSDSPQVLPLEQIQITKPSVINEVRPAVEVPQFSPVVPPIQRQSQDFANDTEVKANKQFISLLLVLVLGVSIVITLVLRFRQKIFGPLTYSDCVAIPESKTVSLRPRYCVTPAGAVFFENRSDAPTEVTSQTNSQEIPTLQN